MKKFIFAFCLVCKDACAYVDPATGSALFTLWVALLSCVLFVGQYMLDNFFFLQKFFKKGKKRVPLLLYSEGNTYWPFFEPIIDELEKRKIATEFYTSSKDDKCFQRNYQYIHPTYIGQGNKAYLTLAMVRADIVLMTTPGLNVFQLKRSKFVKEYVHFFHGLGDHCGYRLFGIDYYDTVLTDNEVNNSYIREIEQKRHLPSKKLFVVGNLLLDKLKDVSLKHNHKMKSGQTILLAPSWGKESVLYRCGDELLDLLSGMKQKVIIRPHP